MPRNVIERVEVNRSASVGVSTTTIFNKDFPLGEGWHKMIIHFEPVLTVGTGTGAISEGELTLFPSIRFRTDKNELIINSCPARFLYRMDQVKSGTLATKNAVAASNGTYNTHLIVWFIDPNMMKPEDTILDTSKYNSVQLEITQGGVGSLLSTVGTASLVTTCDIYLERVKGRLDPKIKPAFYPEYGLIGAPVDPTSTTEFNPERAANLAYKRFHVAATAGTGVVAGTAYSGPAVNTIISDLTVEDDTGFPFNTVLQDIVRQQNKSDYMIETILTGHHVVDFVLDRSILSALFSGDKSRLKVKWANQALPGTPQVTGAYEGIRPVAA